MGTAYARDSVVSDGIVSRKSEQFIKVEVALALAAASLRRLPETARMSSNWTVGVEAAPAGAPLDLEDKRLQHSFGAILQ